MKQAEKLATLLAAVQEAERLSDTFGRFAGMPLDAENLTTIMGQVHKVLFEALMAVDEDCLPLFEVRI